MNRFHVHGKQIELPGSQMKTSKWMQMGWSRVGLLMCKCAFSEYLQTSSIAKMRGIEFPNETV